MKNMMALMALGILTACGGSNPAPSSPPSPEANAAAELRYLAARCPGYVGGITNIKAVQDAAKRQEAAAKKMGITQDQINRTRGQVADQKDIFMVPMMGQAEVCSQTANYVAQFL